MRFQRMCVWLVMAAACGGNSVEISDLPTKLAEAVCKNEVKCQRMPDQATCMASLQVKNRILNTLVAKVQGKSIGYDADQAGDCLDQIASASCAFEGFRPTGDDACLTVFTGTVAPGGACAITTQCANGTCEVTDPNCDQSTTCCPGTCMAIPAKVAIGGDCTNAPCEDNAFCASATNRCTAVIASAGAACDDFSACANPMYCDLGAASPTCVVAAARGATCNTTSLLECADSRDYCDATTMKCTPNVAVGQACGGTNGADCVGYASCTNMVCTADVGAGAMCVATGNNCLGDLSCLSGTCTLPPAEAACPRLDPEPASPQSPVSTARRTVRPTRPEWIPGLSPDSIAFDRAGGQ